ncbi:phosphotransferase [Nonomuraea sp. NPDC005650]|uniref:phosphotransferase n=1 Tax=Nonomuraea sp. NPDC005650 TaxID=3157045 RepID=UPI0033AD9DC0
MTFSKPYATREALEQTIAHHAWLNEHAGSLRLPAIRTVRADGIDFASIEGRHARFTDAPAVATVLGRAHAAAWKGDLHRALLAASPATPVAFYKDTNLRNVLITADGPVMVDLDDLTLAPFGYDLAKLLVTLAMTYGPLPPATFTTSLACYNQPLIDAGLPPVPIGRFLGHAELHHLLTLPYLGKSGYRHPWPTVRPDRRT